MSAKGKMNVPASPTETLVTVERLAGIQNAMGKTLVYGASLPGLTFPGAELLKLRFNPERTPFGYARFYVETIARPGNSAVSRLTYTQYLASGSSTQKSWNFPWSEAADYVILWRTFYGIGRGPEINPLLVAAGDQTEIHLSFAMDTQNGTDYNSWVKNIVVGGCDTAEVPFLVKQGDTVVEKVLLVGI